MKRLLIVIAGVLAVAALGAAPAGAETLNSCLAQHHVCVSDSGRQVISTAQQDQLEQQIGTEPIYLVIATSGSAGYASSMRQLISDLGGHDKFTVGFLDVSQRHFGAYNRGMMPTGTAAGLATQVVRQHRGDGDIFAALTDFVSGVKQQSGSSGDSGSGPPVVVIVLIVLAAGLAVAAIGALLVVQRRTRRRQRQELQEAKTAAQDDLIALSNRLTGIRTDVSVQANPDAAAEQAAALTDYERGTAALDAARRPSDMIAVSRAIGSGQYHLACAEALAAGQPRPDRRPSCFFDPRHGMSVTDAYWTPADGSPARMVPVCADDARKIEQGIEPEMRTVQVAGGAPVAYVNSGFAPSYWGGYGFGGGLFTGFLLGEILAPDPVVYQENFYGNGSGDGGFGGGDFGGGDSDGGGDFGGGDFGGGDFGGGDFGGGDFGGGDF
ncbi:MAG TPA: hypothetical protein VF204_02115 [Streptosporangiaceae bacterium]